MAPENETAERAAQPRLYVEGWSPEYGTPSDPSEVYAPRPSELDLAVETRDWRPLTAPASAVDGVDTVAFVDGVRRIDARLTLDDPVAGPIPGVCGSFAVGAAVWQRQQPACTVAEVEVHRLAVLADGRSADLPDLGPRLAYCLESVPARDPSALIQHLQSRMRAEEGQVASRLARSGLLVVADGPINPLAAQPVIGYVKSHRAAYLPPDHAGIVVRLRPGERTPLFVFDVERYPRYSWYLRLAEVPGGHSWSGVVRCECTAALGTAAARLLADRTAVLLPQVGAALHTDPRAPQNLVPIAALERHLRRMLGDPGLVYRALRQAVA